MEFGYSESSIELSQDHKTSSDEDDLPEINKYDTIIDIASKLGVLLHTFGVTPSPNAEIPDTLKS